MAIGIAVRDDHGITHWASFSERGGRTDAARAIAREFRHERRPRLRLACQDWGLPCDVNQVRRVSTLTRHVTCMACTSIL